MWVIEYLYAFKFFTTWMVVMCLFHKQLHMHIHLLYLAFIVCLMGLYMSFVNPRKFVFYFEGERYVYTGFQKFVIVDMFFHVAVLYAIATMYTGFYGDGRRSTRGMYINAFLLLIIYACITNTKAVYGVPFYEMTAVFVIANIAYYIFYHSK